MMKKKFTEHIYVRMCETNSKNNGLTKLSKTILRKYLSRASHNYGTVAGNNK